MQPLSRGHQKQNMCYRLDHKEIFPRPCNGVRFNQGRLLILGTFCSLDVIVGLIVCISLSLLRSPQQTDKASPAAAVRHAYASSALGLCDVRLSNLRIRFWTTVPISNELAASVISAYLEVEHPVYGFFDADLFLQDLVSQQVEYCSPLLVNSVLFWACVSL